MKPRDERPLRHPVQERPDLPYERRMQILEQLVAQIFDVVWWMNLTPEERAEYEAQGFTAPTLPEFEDK